MFSNSNDGLAVHAKHCLVAERCSRCKQRAHVVILVCRRLQSGWGGRWTWCSGSPCLRALKVRGLQASAHLNRCRVVMCTYCGLVEGGGG